jgi:hypothetical protein
MDIADHNIHDIKQSNGEMKTRQKQVTSAAFCQKLFHIAMSVLAEFKIQIKK